MTVTPVTPAHHEGLPPLPTPDDLRWRPTAAQRTLMDQHAAHQLAESGAETTVVRLLLPSNGVVQAALAYRYRRA